MTRPLRLRVPEGPDYFGQEYSSPSEMSFRELRQYIGELVESGYQPSRLVVRLHQKLSYPLSAVVMVWLAMPFALNRGGRRVTTMQGVALALGLGIAIVRIAEIILFLVLSILAVYLIISLKKISVSIKHIEGRVDDLQKKVEPVLENALSISDNVKEITTVVRSQISTVDSIVDSVKERADSLIDFERKAQHEIETHVFETLNFISAVLTGFKTFFTYLSSNNSRKPRKKRLESISSEADQPGEL